MKINGMATIQKYYSQKRKEGIKKKGNMQGTDVRMKTAKMYFCAKCIAQML